LFYEGAAHGGQELFKKAAEAAASTRQERTWHAGSAFGGGDRSVRNGGAGAAPPLTALEEN
jgi:hypothetical protein